MRGNSALTSAEGHLVVRTAQRQTSPPVFGSLSAPCLCLLHPATTRSSFMLQSWILKFPSQFSSLNSSLWQVRAGVRPRMGTFDPSGSRLRPSCRRALPEGSAGPVGISLKCWSQTSPFYGSSAQFHTGDRPQTTSISTPPPLSLSFASTCKRTENHETLRSALCHPPNFRA